MTVFVESAATAPPIPIFHDATLPDGLRLRYAEQGPAGGPAVLMLHGYTDSSFSFSRVLPLLPPSVRAIVPDQRGHGGSDRPGIYDMDSLANDALRLMDVLQIRRAVVVGHSMGSFVARRLALRAPERVTSLVLIGAGPNACNDSIAELRRAVDQLTDPVDHEFVRDFQLSTVYRTVPPGFMAHAIEESARVPAAVWKGALAGLMDYEPAETQIRVPTLIVGGDRDAVFSRQEQEELARLIPGASLQLYPDIGHAPHWEAPEAFARSLGSAIF